MKKSPSLDDLDLFARIAQAGGLAVVARQSGVSVPTLSRRMRALELQIGVHLFERGSHGYRLTAQGGHFWARPARFRRKRNVYGVWLRRLWWLKFALPRAVGPRLFWRSSCHGSGRRMHSGARPFWRLIRGWISRGVALISAYETSVLNRRGWLGVVQGRSPMRLTRSLIRFEAMSLCLSATQKRHPQDGSGPTMAARSRLRRVARACWLIWHVPEWGRWSCLGLRPPCFRRCSKLVQK